MAEVDVDVRALEQLVKDIDAAKKLLLVRLAERGYRLLRAEVPVDTSNLRLGVARPDVDQQKGEATLTVSAHSAAKGARKATLHLKSGKEKEISLRPTPAYNYAEVVARGNKAVPYKRKPMLIPVTTAPADESYITDGDQIYIVRIDRQRQKANPYDERAATRLEGEVPKIWKEIAEEFFQ